MTDPPKSIGDLDAEAVIGLLSLERHPEGGWYRETWRHDAGEGQRGCGTAIYYLLAAGEVSAGHRVDAAEIWHWYAGASMFVSIAARDGIVHEHRLGNDIASGERPQIVVPEQVWQSARSLGAWTLVGCTVSPAFIFSGFEMAPVDWHPSPQKLCD